jgi:hypothetical protein
MAQAKVTISAYNLLVKYVKQSIRTHRICNSKQINSDNNDPSRKAGSRMDTTSRIEQAHYRHAREQEHTTPDRRGTATPAIGKVDGQNRKDEDQYC